MRFIVTDQIASVSRSVTLVSPAKRPMKPCPDGVQFPVGRCTSRRPIVKYRDTLQSSAQKRRKRSRCRLRYNKLRWEQGIMCKIAVSQKSSHLLTVFLSNLNRFSKFLHCWKHMTFATKFVRKPTSTLLHYLGKFKIQLFCRCGRNANKLHFSSPLTLLFIHKFWYFRYLKYWLQIKFSMSLFFYLFTFAINLWHIRNLSTNTEATCFS